MAKKTGKPRSRPERIAPAAAPSERGPRPDRLTRTLATVALALSLLALALAGYALHAQQRAEEDLREVGRELQRALTPQALPMRGPPLGLDPDDT